MDTVQTEDVIIIVSEIDGVSVYIGPRIRRIIIFRLELWSLDIVVTIVGRDIFFRKLALRNISEGGKP